MKRQLLETALLDQPASRTIRVAGPITRRTSKLVLRQTRSKKLVRVIGWVHLDRLPTMMRIAYCSACSFAPFCLRQFWGGGAGRGESYVVVLEVSYKYSG